MRAPLRPVSAVPAGRVDESLPEGAGSPAQERSLKPRRKRLENRLVWSKSRHGLFEECRRAYFYQYYGAWEGWLEDAPPPTRELYVLKNLSNRATWAGKVVHSLAEMVIRNLLAGHPMALEDAQRIALSKLRADFVDSRDGRYLENPKRHCGLQEHHYAMPVDPRDWKASAALVETCIRNLIEGKIYQRLLRLPPDAILDCERMETFLVGEADAPGAGVYAYAIPDLVVRGRDGKIVILDWKTSDPQTARSAELQLAVYADFISGDYEVEPERILAGEVFLRDGSIRWHTIDRAAIAKARQQVHDSIGRMREPLRDPLVNVAEIEAFPETDELGVCAGCRFRGPCGKLPRLQEAGVLP